MTLGRIDDAPRRTALSLIRQADEPNRRAHRSNGERTDETAQCGSAVHEWLLYALANGKSSDALLGTRLSKSQVLTLGYLDNARPWRLDELSFYAAPQLSQGVVRGLGLGTSVEL